MDKQLYEKKIYIIQEYCNKYLKHNKVGILFSIDITSNNIVKIPLTHFFSDEGSRNEKDEKKEIHTKKMLSYLVKRAKKKKKFI